MADGNTLPSGVHEPDPDEIPIGWRAVQLREIASVTGGGRLGLTKVEHYRPSGYPAYSAAGQDGYVHRWEFARNAVVVPSIGSIGRSYRAEGKWTTLANTQIIFPNEQLLSHRFLHWRTDNTNYFPVSGTAQPFIKPGDFPKCWMSLPPLAEQTWIARVLDSIDAAIHRTESIIAKLKQVKQGLLHDLLTRGIDANGELRPPQSQAPHLYKPSPLGWIPKEWRVEVLEQLTEAGSPITYGVVKPGAEIDGGVPFVRGGDIYEGHVLVDQLRTIEHGISRQYARTLLRGGELLMALVGYPGEVAVVPSLLRGANIARQAAMIRLSADTNVTYVMHYLSSPAGKRQVLASSLGSAQQVVNLADLRSVRVPLAEPSEQIAICEHLSGIAAHTNREVQRLRKSQQIKSGLMDDLLTGRVRVTPLLEAVDAP